MRKKALILIVCLVAMVFVLSSCTEGLKQKPIAGDYSNKEVTSNGGLVVTYGKYLYFINGQAEEGSVNTFGSAVKGAIMRVELNEDSSPKLNTLTTIVPKKVYSTDATYGGIYIYDDYIYYSTTSMKKNSKGLPKSEEKVIMRTKVDGSKSEVIAEFDKHDIPYMVVNTAMVYVEDNNLYRINLNNKKFKPVLIEENIGSTHYFTKASDKSTMDNFVIYTKTDSETAKQSVMVSAIDGDMKKEIFTSSMIGDDATYTAKIIDIQYYKDKLTVFYNIEDDKPNKNFAGIFAYNYDNSFGFDRSKLVRLTKNTNDADGFAYTKFYYINDSILAFGSTDNASKLDLYSVDGQYAYNVNEFEDTIKIYDIAVSSSDVHLNYTSGSKFYKLKILEVSEDKELSVSINDAVVYYDGSFGSQGVSAEIVGDILYFANSKVGNNIYFLNLAKVKARDKDSRKPSVLGIIIDEDRIAAF